MRQFRHLSYSDRLRLETMCIDGVKPKDIADRLGVHVSTVYREVKRGRCVHLNYRTWTFEERYNPEGAEKRYRENLAAKGAPLKIGSDFALADYLERKIHDEKRSPAAALAEIDLEKQHFQTRVCISTLYSYIAKGVFLTLTNSDLPDKGMRKRTYRKVKAIKRPSRGLSIEQRPREVADRTSFGHWEMDTVYSKKDGSKSLLVLTERLTRKEIIERMPNRTAESTIKALNRIERRFGARFQKIFCSITVDNGVEFSDVEQLERSALHTGKRTKFYFCHPYSSYERGSNECLNKMIRRCFPKGTDFGRVSVATIKKVETWMNSYPRKVLDWKTAEICFQECLASLA